MKLLFMKHIRYFTKYTKVFVKAIFALQINNNVIIRTTRDHTINGCCNWYPMNMTLSFPRGGRMILN